nr:D(2) dopamine receptor B-like [Lytechinus pictus]
MDGRPTNWSMLMTNLTTSNELSPSEDIEEIGLDFDISNNTAVNLTYYITSLIFGIPGNVVILRTYARKKRKTSTDILIMGQAVIDLLACSFSLPFIFRSGFPHLTTIGLCRFVFYAEEMFALNAVLMTSLIGIDRYLAVCRPLRRRLTVRKSIALITLCVVFSVSIYVPSPIAISLVMWKGRVVCKIVSLNPLGIVLYVMFISLVFTVSFVVNSILYSLIYVFLQKRAKIHAELTGGTEPTTAVAASTIASSLESNSRANHAEAKSDIPHSLHDTHMKIPSRPLHNSSKLDTSECSNNTNKPPSINHDSDTPGSNLAKSTTEPTKQHKMKLDNNAPSTTVEAVQQGGNQRPNPAKKNKKDFGRKTTRMLLVVTIFLFTTWIPQIGVPFIPSSEILGKDHLKTFISVFYNLRLTNHIVNFYVYYFVNSSFRKEVKESFAKYPCCK